MPEPRRPSLQRPVVLSAILGLVSALICPVLDEAQLHVKQSFWAELLLRAPHVLCPFWVLVGHAPWFVVAILNVALYVSLTYIWLKHRGAVAIPVGVLFVYIAAITIYGIHLRHTATSILEDVSRLKVGQSSYDDVARIAGSHASRTTFEWTFPVAVPGLKQWPEKYECSHEICLFNFRVKNDKLAKIGVSDPAEFSARVMVLRDRVVYVDAALVGGSNSVASGGVEYTDKYRLDPGHGSYSFWGRPFGRPQLWVSIDNDATANQRSHAFALSTKCLFHFGGCNEASDYMPVAFQDFLRADSSQD